MSETLVSIDLGTTRLKVAAFTPAGELLQHLAMRHKTPATGQRAEQRYRLEPGARRRGDLAGKGKAVGQEDRVEGGALGFPGKAPVEVEIGQRERRGFGVPPGRLMVAAALDEQVKVQWTGHPALSSQRPRSSPAAPDEINDRQRAGIEAAKERGVYRGRRKSVDDGEIRRLAGEGVAKARIARDLGVSRMTVYRALAEPET